MQVCPYCAHEIRAGSLFCERCGQTVFEGKSVTLSTKHVQPSNLTPWEGQGTQRIDPHKPVLLYVRGASHPIEIKPAQHSIFLGRIREMSELKPDIDLSSFNAFEKGVSRIHAALRREKETLTIEDMGSANGTFINGQFLVPGQRYTLRHGDEIRLGQLVTNIYFR
jgi:hypothetical protein